MSEENPIKVKLLCQYYHVEQHFFMELEDLGLITIQQQANDLYVNHRDIHRLDKIIRLHQDLEINPSGIDVVLNLLQKIEALEQRLIETKNRLAVFDD